MDIIELMSIILPVIASLCTIFIIFLNLYKKIRRKFPIKVNCWFCNQWSKVEYDYQNSWICPNCDQYNGFTPDGDYNKVIPAQHDEFLNTNVTKSNKNLSENDNGLCNICNNNQRLKVHQLAVFSPIDEAKFDEEIERYQQQLERAYPLCTSCVKVVQKTLRKQKSILLDATLSNSKHLLSFSNLSYELKTARKTFISNFVYILITILAMIEIINTAIALNFFQIFNLGAFGNFRNVFFTLYEFVTYLFNFTRNNVMFVHFQSFDLYQKVIKTIFSHYEYISISLFGLILETSLIFIKTNTRIQFMRSFLWIFNIFCNSSLEMFQIMKILSSLTLILIKTEETKQKSDEKEFENDFVLTSTPEKTFEKSSFNDSAENLFKIENLNIKPSLKVNAPVNTFNLASNDVKSPVFGQKPIFENPFSYRNIFNDSFSERNSVLNGSFISFNETLSSNEEFNLELSINDKLNELHLGTYQKINKNEIPKAFKISRPISKPVLSPPKLGNLTQSSWLAGGYWKSDFSNLSRSSSHSSGFGSQTSTQNLEAFNSLPPSRNTSICGEDRFSVLSEPVTRPIAFDYSKNHRGPHLQPHRPPNLFGDHGRETPTPSTANRYFVPLNPQKTFTNLGCQISNLNLTKPILSLPTENIWPDTRPPSVFSTNSVRSFGTSKIYNKNNGYVKGSLLQKWREQNCLEDK